MPTIKWDIPREQLIEAAIEKEKAIQTPIGAIVVQTGLRTGRSPDAKFIVRDELTDQFIDWQSNSESTKEEFESIKALAVNYLAEKDHYKQRLYAGNDKKNRLKLVVETEYAWQGLFANNMFVRPTIYERTTFDEPDWHLFCAPSASDTPRVMVDFTDKEIVITGTHYAGEIKKSIFTVLNFLLPAKDILPMHCSVNMSLEKDNPAIFFGLSGTGKTTLSSDETRILIGDDEHGWSSTGLFNFEGGCYAKVINLSQEDEPQIWDACQQEGSILENVVLGPDNVPDFNDSSLTENTRGSYDLSCIKNASLDGVTSHPKNVIFLTCDAFGVLPPVAKLTAQEASDHFIMGYTAKVAGTEAGVTEPQATFSHCFGAPFMPLPAEKYAELLKEKIDMHDADCWLVNTGWSGGGYGVGSRMPIEVSRAIVNKIISGEMARKEYAIHEYTSLNIPTNCQIPIADFAEPEKTWESLDEYKTSASSLMKLFADKREELSI